MRVSESRSPRKEGREDWRESQGNTGISRKLVGLGRRKDPKQSIMRSDHENRLTAGSELLIPNSQRLRELSAAKQSQVYVEVAQVEWGVGMSWEEGLVGAYTGFGLGLAALEGVKGRGLSCCWIHTFIISIQQARVLKAGRSSRWSKATVTHVSQRRGCLVFLLQCPCLCPASDRVPKGPTWSLGSVGIVYYGLAAKCQLLGTFFISHNGPERLRRQRLRQWSHQAHSLDVELGIPFFRAPWLGILFPSGSPSVCLLAPAHCLISPPFSQEEPSCVLATAPWAPASPWQGFCLLRGLSFSSNTKYLFLFFSALSWWPCLMLHWENSGKLPHLFTPKYSNLPYFRDCFLWLLWQESCPSPAIVPLSSASFIYFQIRLTICPLQQPLSWLRFPCSKHFQLSIPLCGKHLKN